VRRAGEEKTDRSENCHSNFHIHAPSNNSAVTRKQLPIRLGLTSESNFFFRASRLANSPAALYDARPFVLAGP
jgi:hypothetical protein